MWSGHSIIAGNQCLLIRVFPGPGFEVADGQSLLVVGDSGPDAASPHLLIECHQLELVQVGDPIRVRGA